MPRYILLLELGRRDNKICGLETKHVRDGDRKKILSLRPMLNKLSLDKKLTWLKNNCPNTMQAYKEIYESNISVISTHPIEEN